jgi:hypothetical protein
MLLDEVLASQQKLIRRGRSDMVQAAVAVGGALCLGMAVYYMGWGWLQGPLFGALGLAAGLLLGGTSNMDRLGDSNRFAQRAAAELSVGAAPPDDREPG